MIYSTNAFLNLSNSFQMSPIPGLPKDIFYHILEEILFKKDNYPTLSKMCKVCKKWNSIITDDRDFDNNVLARCTTFVYARIVLASISKKIIHNGAKRLEDMDPNTATWKPKFTERFYFPVHERVQQKYSGKGFRFNMTYDSSQADVTQVVLLPPARGWCPIKPLEFAVEILVPSMPKETKDFLEALVANVNWLIINEKYKQAIKDKNVPLINNIKKIFEGLRSKF